jgi:DNA/RNA-binding domain of Phe-tRNA-synthetase-like protein
MEETKVTDSTKDVLLVAYGIPGLSKEEIKEGEIASIELHKAVCRW